MNSKSLASLIILASSLALVCYTWSKQGAVSVLYLAGMAVIALAGLAVVYKDEVVAKVNKLRSKLTGEDDYEDCCEENCPVCDDFDEMQEKKDEDYDLPESVKEALDEQVYTYKVSLSKEKKKSKSKTKPQPKKKAAVKKKPVKKAKPQKKNGKRS